MGLLGDVVGGITGFANLGGQMINLDWQKKAQKTTWKREDMAVQRRVADLEAAGLNPVLAAGSGAESSAPIRTEAPQMESLGDLDVLGAMLQRQALKKSAAEISRTQAETDRIRAEVDLAERKELREAEYQQAMMRNLSVSTNKGVLESQGIGIKNQYIAREKSAGIDRVVAQTSETLIKNKSLNDRLEADLKSRNIDINKESLSLRYLEEKLNQEQSIRSAKITAANMANMYMTTKGYKLKGETAEKMIRALDDDHAMKLIEVMIRKQDWEVLEKIGVHENMISGFYGQAMSSGALLGKNVQEWIGQIIDKIRKR